MVPQTCFEGPRVNHLEDPERTDGSGDTKDGRHNKAKVTGSRVEPLTGGLRKAQWPPREINPCDNSYVHI